MFRKTVWLALPFPFFYALAFLAAVVFAEFFAGMRLVSFALS